MEESPSANLAAFVRFVMAEGGSPIVELATFSGDENDWAKDGNAIVLRLTRTGVTDSEESPHELRARLFAPAGIFIIPDKPTEMLVIAPPGGDEAPGIGWCFHGAQLPPQAVTQAIARWDVSDGTELLASAGGWTFRGGPSGESFVFVDRETGMIGLTLAGGTGIVIDKANNLIEMKVTDGAKPASQTLAMLRLSAQGVLINAKAAAIMVGTDGQVQSVGSGAFIAAHPGGCLGPAPSVPVGLPGGAASALWKVAG